MDFYNQLIRSSAHVFSFQLDGKGGGTPLHANCDADAPCWIHLDYSEADCYELLQQAGLSESAIDSLVRSDTRPRSLSLGGGRLLILRAVNLNPGSSPDDMVSIRFWWDSNRLISLRQRKILSTQDIKTEIEAGDGPTNIPDLLFGIIERMADRVSDFVDGLEEQVETFEELSDTMEPNALRREVVQVRRHAAAVKRYLSPQREALESFSRLTREQLGEAQLMYLHEQADRIVRYVEDLDLLKEKSILLQEELMNRIAQEQNARMYVLSIIAAIFLPISFITGFFGMNVAGLPGIENPKAFLGVSLLMGCVTAGILLWLRRRRWL